MAGIYEITERRISFDTGVKTETVQKALERFAKDKKAFYKDNYIVLVNFFANQRMNPNMVISAKKEFNELPESVQNVVVENDLKGFETLRNGLGMVRKIRKKKEEKEVEVEVEDFNTILIDESSAKKISKKNSVEEKQFDPTDLRQKFDEGVLTEEEKMLRAKAFRHRFKEEGEWKRNFAINRKLKTTERVDFALIEFIRTQLVDCDQVYAHTISSAKKYFTNWYDKKYPKTVNAF